MKSLMTTLATSRRVRRRPFCGTGVPGSSPTSAAKTARIEPERSMTSTMSMPLSSERWSRSTETGRAMASTRKPSATARSTPGTSRSQVRAPRGPASRGITVPMRIRGRRRSCPKVPHHQTSGQRTRPSNIHGCCQLTSHQALPRTMTG
jgi:hypothetical protein